MLIRGRSTAAFRRCRSLSLGGRSPVAPLPELEGILDTHNPDASLLQRGMSKLVSARAAMQLRCAETVAARDEAARVYRDVGTAFAAGDVAGLRQLCTPSCFVVLLESVRSRPKHMRHIWQVVDLATSAEQLRIGEQRSGVCSSGWDEVHTVRVAQLTVRINASVVWEVVDTSRGASLAAAAADVVPPRASSSSSKKLAPHLVEQYWVLEKCLSPHVDAAPRWRLKARLQPSALAAPQLAARAVAAPAAKGGKPGLPRALAKEMRRQAARGEVEGGGGATASICSASAATLAAPPLAWLGEARRLPVVAASEAVMGVARLEQRRREFGRRARAWLAATWRAAPPPPRASAILPARHGGARVQRRHLSRAVRARSQISSSSTALSPLP